ncbi:MAG TPA: hypothetical protein VHN98_01150 [Acidimicrobiales bacterium]|nr:hypothetical protein [Acidimicrobiales bacterium]
MTADHPGPTPSIGERLVAGEGALWGRITTHPFVVAAADGTLDRATFDRWLVEDHFFVLGFRRFLARLVALAPEEPARDVLAGALGPLGDELALFRSEASARGLDLDAEPCPTNLGYTSFLTSSLDDGWPVALTVLYGAERAYFDAWSAVRASADEASPYWRFVDNWSSSAFGEWVGAIDALLGDGAGDRPAAAVRRAFGRVVRFELRFWDAVHAGERW